MAQPAPRPPAADVPDALRRVPLFAALADDDLRWIVAEGDEVVLAPGEPLFETGDPVERMYVGIEGAVEARREQPGAPVWTFGAGEIYGVVPFSRMQSAPSTGRALGPTRVFRFPRGRFDALLRRAPSLEAGFVALLADRVRESTRRDQQFEKLTSLGRLSAGLAHELNNPAAAARRSAADARARLADGARRAAALVDALGPASCRAALLAPDALRERAARASGGEDDPLDRADRQDEVEGWLERAGAADAPALAATFADARLGAADLDAVLGALPAPARAPAAAWCEAALALDALLATVERAAGRVSELVGAVKSFTHMDRGLAAEPVDLREGVETTLTLFAHKFRDRRVALARELPAGLPRVRGFAGELNQVWANLIDNALDAAAAGPSGAARVVVRAAAEGDRVRVEVEDNGAGVPREIQARIWEPFFTTKAVGRGTGLGLDIARRVVEQHGGELALDSQPGRTRFAVRLPALADA